MHRTKGHAWLLASAALGAALCLEWLNLERTSVRAGAAVAAAVPAPEAAVVAPPAAGASAKRKHASAVSEPAVDPEPEQISARSEKAPPPPPKLVSPPVEAKRPPKKSVVAASEPKRVVDNGPKPPAFVRSLIDGVNAVLGQP
jgi:hypothetical protein